MCPNSSKWCCNTGLIVCDNGGAYGVGNNMAYNQNQLYDKNLTYPTYVSIKYGSSKYKTPELYFFDLNTLTEVYTNPRSGKTIRILKIASQGKNLMNTRKIEKLAENSSLLDKPSWITEQVFAYDDLGRLKRKIYGSDISDFKYSSSGKISEIIKNGVQAFYMAPRDVSDSLSFFSIDKSGSNLRILSTKSANIYEMRSENRNGDFSLMNIDSKNKILNFSGINIKIKE